MSCDIVQPQTGQAEARLNESHTCHFSTLLKLPPISKNSNRLFLFLLGYNCALNCGNWESMGEQDGESETMGSTP